MTQKSHNKTIEEKRAEYESNRPIFINWTN